MLAPTTCLKPYVRRAVPSAGQMACFSSPAPRWLLGSRSVVLLALLVIYNDNVGRLDHGNETLSETHECCTAEPASYKRMLSYFVYLVSLPLAAAQGVVKPFMVRTHIPRGTFV